MRVAEVCPRYYPFIGGVETHVKEISERLAQRGFEIEVLTTDPTKSLPMEDFINGVRIKRFHSFAPNECYYISRGMLRYLRENSRFYDILHAHCYHSIPALYAVQAKSKNPLIFTSHYHGKGHTFFRNILHIPYRLIGKRIFERADKVICVSRWEKSLVMSNFKIPEERIVVVPNGISLEDIDKARPYKNIHGKEILYVGRLEKYKNVELLINALVHMPAEYKLTVIGTGSYKKNLLNRVKDLNLEERVLFLSQLDDGSVRRWMKSCSIFVTLSEAEAFGITVLEALASGKPVVVNDVASLSELAREFPECVLPVDVRTSDSFRLAQLIQEWVGCKERANVSSFDWGKISETIGRLFLSVTQRS